MHIAAFLSVRSLPQRDLPSPSEVTVCDETVEVDVALVAEDEGANAAPSQPHAHAPTSAAVHARSGGIRANDMPGAPRSTAEREAAPTPPSNESAAPAMLVMPSPAAIGVAGAGALNPFLARGASSDPPSVESGSAPSGSERASARPAPPTKGEATRRTTEALREGITRRAALGLGPEGPVLDALRDSTYSSAAPVIGTATFVATIDASGVVVDLRLANTRPRGKEAERGWQDALGRARGALAHKKLALRGAHGAELRIGVTSDFLLPSGNRPKDLPVQPTSLTGGSFDLSDIAAKPRRIVHASLESSRELDFVPAPVRDRPDAGN